MQNPALNQRVSIDKYHGLRLHINTPAKNKKQMKRTKDIQQQPQANKKNESDQNKIIL